MLQSSDSVHTVHLVMPGADAVTIVVKKSNLRIPMQAEGDGKWVVNIDASIDQLFGKAYELEVCKNGDTLTIADPFAHRTQRVGDRIQSFFSKLDYPWRCRHFRTPPISRMVIYEAHLPALSRHPSAKVAHESHRGTYKGAMSTEILDHLQRLQVAVEFLPLHASDQLLGQDWGYFSTSYHAMRDSYAHQKDHVNYEVMALVDSLHARGVPVILDVVFNHGAELWVRAWGEEIVYRQFESGHFCNGSGCGPTVRTEHPMIREAILQTLEHLLSCYRFDGFRFDLGALHDKETMLAIDRRLPKRVYLIAEPWALGGSQWGKGDLAHVFKHTRWAVWNDDFREPARTFLTSKGDHLNRDRLMVAIKGNHIQDGSWAVRPQQCINYVSCHDGKTLADLVQGDKKRAFLGIMMVLTAQGVPMIGEGSEMLYSKHGHDNSYDRPDLNQLDWSQVALHQDLIDAVVKLIALRKRFSHFRYTRHLRDRNGSKYYWDIDWIFPTGHPHRDNVNAIGYTLHAPAKWCRWPIFCKRLIVLLNGSHVGTTFHLPEGKWVVMVDGNSLEVNYRGVADVPPAEGDYYVHPGTGVLLRSL